MGKLLHSNEAIRWQLRWTVSVAASFTGVGVGAKPTAIKQILSFLFVINQLQGPNAHKI